MLKHQASTPNRPTICSPLYKYFSNPHQQSNAGSDNFSGVVNRLAHLNKETKNDVEDVYRDLGITFP